MDQRLPRLTRMAMRVLTSRTVATNCTNQQTYTNSAVSHVSHNDAVHREWGRQWTKGRTLFLFLFAILQNLFICAFKLPAIFHGRLRCNKLCAWSAETSAEWDFCGWANNNNNNNNKFWLPINSSLLTITLYSSVVTIFAYNDTKYSFAALQPSLTVLI